MSTMANSKPWLTAGRRNACRRHESVTASGACERLGSRAAPAHAVQLEAMPPQLEAQARGERTRQGLDRTARHVIHLAAADADRVVVVRRRAEQIGCFSVLARP